MHETQYNNILFAAYNYLTLGGRKPVPGKEGREGEGGNWPPAENYALRNLRERLLYK